MGSVQHCLCVLFDRAPDLGAVAAALRGWEPVGHRPPDPGQDGWMACGPALAFSLRSGLPVLVDVLGRPWPDEVEPGALEEAWRAGWFGPCSCPGALERAKQHSWAWQPGARYEHGGLVRLRTLDGGGGEPAASGSDPVYHLTALTEMAAAVLALPGAGALFTPGGEALRGREQVALALQRKAGLDPPPIELWLNLRAFDGVLWGGERWVIVDLIGMSQLGLPDQEAFFAVGREQPGGAERLVRAASHRLLAGYTIREGATAGDPSGRRWRASAARGIAWPPRRVVRWTAVEGAGTAQALEALAARTEGNPGAPQASFDP